MADRPPFRIAVVGAGVAAAMAAALLSRGLSRQRYAVILVETQAAEAEPFGPVEASMPSVRGFHARLGLDESVLIKSAAASFSLGIDYRGWSASGGTDFLPFGDVGATLDGVAFHQIAHRIRAEGHQVELADYAIAALLARAGRFAHPSNDPRSPLSTYSYGLHLDLTAYTKLLRRMAANFGTARSSSPFAAVEADQHGGVAAIRTVDGERIHVDLVVDATGAAASVISQLPDARFVSWRDWLPCDRSLSWAAASSAAPAPLVRVTAHGGGWRRSVQAGAHVGEVVAFASEWSTSEQAAAQLSRPLAVQESRFEQGRQSSLWIRNCVAIGAAAAVLEPMASTSLHLLMSAVERLLMMIPADRPRPLDAREYNRLTGQELDRTRDFAILRYKLGMRSDGPLWSHVREMPVPEELAHKIGEFARRGRVPLLDGDMFDESEWATTFDALGVRPKRRDLLADAVPAQQLVRQLERMRSLMHASVSKVPLHGSYLAELMRRAAA